MRTKSLVIAAILAMVLAGCDRIVFFPDDRLLAMTNDVGAAYDLTFEDEELGPPEGAILIIYAHEEPYSKEIPYTEVLIEDFTKLNEIDDNILLFSTEHKEMTILFYVGRENIKDNVIYKVDGETLSLKHDDAEVPLGNIVERNEETKALRQIILVPKWHTFGTGFSFTTDDADQINNVEMAVSDNFAVIMEEVSKHIELHSEGSPDG